MNDLTANNYRFISNYFDKQLFQFDILSVLGLILYFPLGSLLLLLRVSLIIFLNLMLHLKPNLRVNYLFIQLTCLCMGMHTRVNDEVLAKENDSHLKILISNHVSCLDFFSIKTLYNKCNAATSHMHSNRSLDASLNRQPRSLTGYFENIFCNIFHNASLVPNEDSSKNKSNYPLVYFPELMATNGRHGLLRFDVKPFDLDVADSHLVYTPTCIRVRRPFIPLSVNYMYSNNFTNIVFTLFAPVTLYDIFPLKSERKGPSETSEQFAERIRGLISEKLGLNLLTDMNCNNFQLIWSSYHAERKQAAAAAANVSRARINAVNSSNYSMSFEDISRLALQIKEILPDVSYEVIQSHIRNSSTLDIDTVIASILDASTSLIASTSSSSPSNQQPVTQRSPQPVKEFNRKNSFKNYEERKFDLINEARKRYLAKNVN